MYMKKVLMLTLLGLLDLTPGTLSAQKYNLYKTEPEVSFPEKLVVHNRTVTCSGVTMGKKYGFKMYTCDKIRVDGWPIFHGNNDFKNLRDRTPNNNGCPGCPCGSYTAQPNNILELCAAMLKEHGYPGEVVAAYTPVPVCTQTQPENRIKFYVEDGQQHWLEVHANNGYLSKLQCSVTA